MNITWQGLDRFTRDMERAGRKKIKQQIRKQLRAAAIIVRKAMKKNVSGPILNVGQDRIVKKEAHKGGTLKKSIRMKVRVRGRYDWFATIGHGGKGFYGDFHVRGTKRLPKRDFITASVEETKSAVEKQLGAVFRVIP